MIYHFPAIQIYLCICAYSLYQALRDDPNLNSEEVHYTTMRNPKKNSAKEIDTDDCLVEIKSTTALNIESDVLRK